MDKGKIRPKKGSNGCFTHASPNKDISSTAWRMETKEWIYSYKRPGLINVENSSPHGG